MRTQASIMVHPSLLINANDRPHHFDKAEKTAALRTLGRHLGQQLDRADGRKLVIYTLGMLDRQRRDPANWHPSAKAWTDGLKDAGVFPDDSDEYVQGPLVAIGALSPEASRRPARLRRIQVTVTITDPTEAVA